MLFSISHKSSVPYQFPATGRSGTACCSQDWGHRMKYMHESPSVNILLRTKLLSLNPLSGDMDCLLTLWPLLIPCFLDNGYIWFSDLYHCRKKFLVQQPVYAHRKIIKAPLLDQRLGSPCLFSLSLCLSLPPSLSLPSANSLEHGSLPSSLSLPWLSRPRQEGALCLSERCKPCSRVLLVLCVNQGISASFSLSFSYCRLQTTRFQSIKGPQQADFQEHLSWGRQRTNHRHFTLWVWAIIKILAVQSR